MTTTLVMGDADDYLAPARRAAHAGRDPRRARERILAEAADHLADGEVEDFGEPQADRAAVRRRARDRARPPRGVPRVRRAGGGRRRLRGGVAARNAAGGWPDVTAAALLAARARGRDRDGRLPAGRVRGRGCSRCCARCGCAASRPRLRRGRAAAAPHADRARLRRGRDGLARGLGRDVARRARDAGTSPRSRPRPSLLTVPLVAAARHDRRASRSCARPSRAAGRRLRRPARAAAAPAVGALPRRRRARRPRGARRRRPTKARATPSPSSRSSSSASRRSAAASAYAVRSAMVVCSCSAAAQPEQQVALRDRAHASRGLVGTSAQRRV